MSAAALLATTLLLASGQADPGGVTVVDGVEVIGDPMDYRLRVTLAGADRAGAMVLSSDPAMWCGDARFNNTPGPFRQCWLRGFRGEPIVLTAQNEGQFGRDWTVEWTGCQPLADGRSCSAEIAGEMQVGATFRRGG
ncbi:hypothetical protein [Brevundimonas sp.]|uniref:hypothetical protein n=1 Tax=Brevundimonas sp. TaxID=1871086 RepID=UPI00260143F5|nr:hypothetical protein [Brevundimonas sp.]